MNMPMDTTTSSWDVGKVAPNDVNTDTLMSMTAPLLESGQAAAMSLLISGLIAAVIALLLSVFTLFLANTRGWLLPSSRALALLVFCLPLLGWAMSGVVEGVFWAQNPPLVEPLMSVAEPIITFLVVPLRIIGLLVLLLRLVVSYHRLPTLCSWPPHFNPNDSPKVYRQGPIWATKVLFLSLLPFISVFVAHMVVIFHIRPSIQLQDVIGARIRFSFAVIEGVYILVVSTLLCVLFPVANAIKQFDLHVMRTAATSLLTLLIYLLVTCALEYYRMQPKTFENMRDMQHKIEAVALAQTVLYHVNMYLNIALWCLLYYAARTIEIDAKSEGVGVGRRQSTKPSTVYPSYLASESVTLITDEKKAPQKVKEKPVGSTVVSPSSDTFNYKYTTAAPLTSRLSNSPSQDCLFTNHNPLYRQDSGLTRQDSLYRYSSVGSISSPKLTRNFEALTRPRSESVGREQMRRIAKLNQSKKRLSWEKSQPLANIILMDSQEEIANCVRTSSV